MLGYVHLTAGRPVLERRAAAGMTYWALEGDLDGGLFPAVSYTHLTLPTIA